MRISSRQGWLGAIAIAALLTACSTPEENTRATALETTAQPVVDTETGRAERIESVYTSLDLDACELLDVNEEGQSKSWLCEGYQDVPLYITDSDARFDVDAGVQDNSSTTSGRAFNKIGDTVEWRIRDGEPVAAILRFDFTVDGRAAESSELAVLSIGSEGSPGCLINWIEADAQPSQNEAARQTADEQAEGFNCHSQIASEVQLPPSILGTFDKTQAECDKPGTTMGRLTLFPDKLSFYYGYADVDAVQPKDNGYDVDATLYHQEGVEEVVPTPAEYRIESEAQGDRLQLEWVSAGLEKSSFVRCNEP